jgi:hypothetical protein
MTKVYWFTFADGTRIICRGMNKVELNHEILKHGKLISKIVSYEGGPDVKK